MTMAISIAIAAEKEILAIIFLIVYIVFNPKINKEVDYENSLLQVYIDDDINIFNYDLPSDYFKKFSKISNVEDRVVLEFILDNKGDAKSIVGFLEEKFPNKIKYELI
jgi:hypothetical protein